MESAPVLIAIPAAVILTALLAYLAYLRNKGPKP